MNILFLSIYEIKDSNSGYIYADLIKEFGRHNHNIYAVTPTRTENTNLKIDDNGIHIIYIKNGQIQKTGKIKKVINLLSLEKKTIKAVKKFAKDVKFDLIVSMSSSLSYFKVMEYFKKRDRGVAYLLNKDIFPQNAVDIGLMKTTGLMGFVYKHFRKKEKKMYDIADYIGCISQSNVSYIAKNNPEIDKSKLTIVPNSIEPINVSLSIDEIAQMRDKYGIPQDKIVFVYGGNLGKPQNIPFIIECLKSQRDNDQIYFFIVGDGTEFDKLQTYIDTDKPQNVKLLQRLPREDFDRMLAACNIGMIFLDHRFTIPNYPSRLLSYMQAGLPVLACTDPNTDVGKDIVDGGFGWWCESNGTSDFSVLVNDIMNSNLQEIGKIARNYLETKFSVTVSYETIMSQEV